MDERIRNYLEDLKKNMEGLPEEEIKAAVTYYEEYLCDAVEEGKNLDEVLKGLKQPEKIAQQIRTETSINKAQKDPGIRNFANALKNAFRSVSTPLMVFSLSLVVFIAFSLVAVFFAGAFTLALGAVTIGLTLFYEAFTTPLRFLMEIIGKIGIAIFGAGICSLLAIFLYQSGRFFIRVSMRMIRVMLKRPDHTVAEKSQPEAGRASKPTHRVRNILIATAAGLLLFLVSGIPWRFFTIFNSMKPEGNIQRKAFEYHPETFNKISAVTAHSVIKLTRSSSDKIVLSYEKPDWLDYEIGNEGSMLSFYEKSNGRLPLFDLVKFHESMTELEIAIPEGYTPDIVILESTGGHILIDGINTDLQAQTVYGNIMLKTEGFKEGYNIRAGNKNDEIIINGAKAGQKVQSGIEYYKNTGAEKTIELYNTNGRIQVD